MLFFSLRYIQIWKRVINNHNVFLKNTQREKAPSNKTQTLLKDMNLDIWRHQMNSLYVVSKLKQNFQKKIVNGKTPSFVHFVVLTLFVLKLAFDRAASYGNVALSILVFSTKKRYFFVPNYRRGGGEGSNYKFPTLKLIS